MADPTNPQTAKRLIEEKGLGGRPTKYRREFAQMLIDYMDHGEEPWEEYDEDHATTRGDHYTIRKRRPKNMRFITRFAWEIGCDIDTFEKWAKDPRKPEFGGAYARARAIQAEYLLGNGVVGLTDATMAKFAAVNLTDLRDRTESELTVNAQSLTDIAAIVGAEHGDGD